MGDIEKFPARDTEAVLARLNDSISSDLEADPSIEWFVVAARQPAAGPDPATPDEIVSCGTHGAEPDSITRSKLEAKYGDRLHWVGFMATAEVVAMDQAPVAKAA